MVSASLRIGFEAERHAWLPFWRVFWAIVTVEESLLVFRSFFAILGDLVTRSWVGISAAGGDEFLCPFDIDILTLSLEVWAVFSALVWTFIPIKANPLQSVFNKVGSTLNVACAVGVFDAQDKSALILLCNKIRIDGGTEIADMNIAGRRRRKTSNYFHRTYYTIFCPIDKRAKIWYNIDMVWGAKKGVKNSTEKSWNIFFVYVKI